MKKQYSFILVDSDSNKVVKRSNNFKTILKEWKKYNYNRMGGKYSDRWGSVKELVDWEYKETPKEWLVR